MTIGNILGSLKQCRLGERYPDILSLSAFEFGTPDQAALDTPTGQTTLTVPARPTRGRKRADDFGARYEVDDWLLGRWFEQVVGLIV